MLPGAGVDGLYPLSSQITGTQSPSDIRLLQAFLHTRDSNSDAVFGSAVETLGEFKIFFLCEPSHYCILNIP